MSETLRGGGGQHTELEYFTDLEMAQRLPRFAEFARQGPCAGIAGMLMRSERVCFLYDQFFRQRERGVAVGGGGARSGRRAGGPASTPWHQDQPYWQVSGTQVVSVWLPLDPTPAGAAIQFVRGSHKWGEHSPFHFATGAQYAGTGMPRLPDISTAVGC